MISNDEIAQDKISVNMTSDIFQECADVFEGTGCLDVSYHIEIDPSVKPVIHPPRRVPATLKDPLKKELDRMVEEGMLTSVNEPIDWVSSMVTVVKPNKLRIYQIKITRLLIIYQFDYLFEFDYLSN